MSVKYKLLALAVGVIGVAVGSWPVSARHRAAYHYCDPQMGDAVRPAIQALNILKNRQSAPAANDIDRTASLAAMLHHGDDRNRWDDHKAAQPVGYVADVKMGGVETVNCHARSIHGRDTHIDLTLSATDAYDEARHVIVEVTPRWRVTMAAKGVDWETDTLREKLLGRCVKVTGWLLFDAEHRRQSQNTADASAQAWRATAWEIHPVTALEVLPTCGRQH